MYKKNLSIALGLLTLVAALSCSDGKQKIYTACSLEKSDKVVTFPIDPETRNNPYVYAFYRDKNSSEYFTMQNSEKRSNDILFYDWNKRQLAFKVKPTKEGPNGVGWVSGYYIHNLDSIYLVDAYGEQIFLINQKGEIKDKFNAKEYINGVKLSGYKSYADYPLMMIQNKLYVTIDANRFLAHEPVTATINTDTKETVALPFEYPDYPGSDQKIKKSGYETFFGRCFDGERFVYSFAYKENVYVTSPAHDSVQQVPVKTEAFDQVKLMDEMGATLDDMFNTATYGPILYDEYRNVFYRIVYPPIKKEAGDDPMLLRMYGSKNFNIIITDHDFRILGEVHFPDNTYNPRVMLVRPEGLYISESHPLNESYSDDELKLRLFELVIIKS